MNQKCLVPLYEGPMSGFPAAEELPEGAAAMELQDTLGYWVRFLPGIEYACRDGERLHVHLLLPSDPDPERRFPLVVFVQGSAWHRQDIFGHLAHMFRLSERGFAVALAEYRPSETAPFPAQMQDVKTAVRFLRKNAQTYRIDPERVGLWGDSSGGHTVLMAGFTADREPDTSLYGEESAGVRCIVDWYGPTDIARMNCAPSTQDHTGPDSPEGFLIGRKNVLESPDLAAATVPMNYLRQEIPTPPVLILHGDRDELVPFDQSCRLYEALRSMGREVELYKLKGAGHGWGGFHSPEALEISFLFLEKHLKGE